MTKIKKQTQLFFAVAGLSFLFLLHPMFYILHSAISAASPFLYFSAPASEIAPGSEFSVRVLLDAEQALNAYSVSLYYPPEYLEVTGFNNGRSVIDVWQSQPLINNGKIEFRGGSTSPFKGQGGELLAINFRATKEGIAELGFITSALYPHTQNALGILGVGVYLADGKGTRAAPVSQNIKFAIKEGAALLQLSPFGADKTTPEIKFLSLVQDPFNGDQKLLSFSVADLDSGIKETEARFRSYFSWSEWRSVQNPAAVPAPAWEVDFRATDNAGNILEKVLYDWMALARSFAEILFVIVVVAIVFPAFFRLRNR